MQKCKKCICMKIKLSEWPGCHTGAAAGCWLPPLIRMYSVSMFSVFSLLFDFISCLFVCPSERNRENVQKNTNTKWNENRLKLTHRRADLVLYTSASLFIFFSFSMFWNILHWMPQRKTNPLPLCMCRSALWLHSFTRQFIFSMRVHFNSLTKGSRNVAVWLRMCARVSR